MTMWSVSFHIFFDDAIKKGRDGVDRYEHQEGDGLVIKAQEILFSTIDNIHSTPINAKAQVVLELVSPITLWIF